MNSFPENPSRRRVVIVLSEYDLERCANEDGGAAFLYDDEVYILQFPPPPDSEATPALQNILDSGLARPGTVLLQDPYDSSRYVDSLDAVQRFALAKHMHFSTFCKLLGAKRVQVEQVDLQTSSGQTTLSMEGERLGNHAEIQTDIESVEKLMASMSLCAEFKGSAPDLQAAEYLLRDTGLLADPVMYSLFQMKRDYTNDIKRMTLCLNVSNEAKRSLTVIGKLSLPAILSVSASLDRITTEEQAFTLTITVSF